MDGSEKLRKEFERKLTTKNDGTSVNLRESLKPKRTNMDASDVKTREDFILFLKELDADYRKERQEDEDGMLDREEWAHRYIGDYLEAMAVWTDDADYLRGKESLSWGEVAELFSAAKVYE